MTKPARTVNGLQPYPAYKPSGMEWLGDVPAHWRIVRNGQIFVQRNETGFPELPILEVSLNTGVRVRNLEDLERKQMMTVRSEYKRAVAGDIAYNMMRMWQGAVGVTPADGLVSPAYVVARPLNGTEPRYFSALFRTSAYTTEVDRSSRGIVKDRNRLYWIDFKQLASPCPPIEEQAAIARYLDHADERIRRCIQSKEKLVKLLGEQWQALVNEAVTGRIDVRTGQPYPEYKPSGVEWLGKVPAHWEVRRLGQMGTLSKGNGGSKDDEEPEGLSCVRYGDLYTTHTRFIWRSRAFVSRSRAADYTPLEHGDVLFAASGETIDEIGKSAVNLRSSDTYCGADIIVFRPMSSMHAPYMGYATDCWSSAVQKATMGRGFTVVHIYATQLKRLVIAVPTLPEQAAISRYLDRADERIQHCIRRAQRQIELLNEYRTRLISDVVTGKLDVRQAAATLPEVDPLSVENGDVVLDEHAVAHPGGPDASPKAAEAKT